MQDYSGYGQPPAGDFGSTSPLPPIPPPPPPPPRRRIGLLSYVAVALAAGALGAGTVVAVYHPASSSVAAVPQPSSSAIAPAAPLPSTVVPTPSSGGSGVSGDLSSVERGLVIINTTLQYSSEQAAGTGMVIDAGTGLVLTNNHVIENATKITATVAATGRNFPAKVVGYDVTGDIAVLRLQNPSGLHAVPIGDAAKLKTGDSVVALGNADGQSQIVSAPGRVTGLNQTITASDQGGTVKTETLHGMIETNADVVAGDSGGSLVNSAGQVIGIDTAGNTVSSPGQQSVSGYAIPINTARSVASQIVAGHASSAIVIGYPPFIGIYVGQGTSSNPHDQSPQQQPNNGFGGFGGSGGFGNGNGSGNGSNPSCYTSDANLSAPSTIASVNSGTLVLGTICGSPAAAAGLTAGSVITSVNGHTVGSPHSLASVMSKLRPGDTVSVTWVTPNNQHQTANLLLTAGPPQ
jgi:S1-C subfamily serine protease